MPGSSFRRLALAALALGVTTGAAIPFGGCGSKDDETPSPAEAGADGPAPPDAEPDAPGGCAADRASDGMWQHLRCAGFYEDIATKRVDPKLRPYKPALELWSDGAAKERFIFLPPGTKIDTSSMDEWVFPPGTRVWKEFSLDKKRIETRLYEKGDDGAWRHASFRWTENESDAVRVDDGVKIPRGAEVPPYEIPSANQCNDCHVGRKDRLLGFEAVSLGLPGAEGVTLAVLVAEGWLSAPPSSTTLAFPEDGTGTAAGALAWMHVSCGPCHNRASSASAEKSRVYTLARASQLLDQDGGSLTVQSLDAYLSTVGRATSVEIPDGGGATFSVIKAGDPGASLASYLSGRRVGPTGNPNVKEQMPPLVTRRVDVTGHGILDTWIRALPP